MKNLLMFILVLIFFASCNKVEKKYYPNGKIKEKITIYNNEETNFLRELYYPNGNLKQEMKFTDSKIDGWVKDYYEDGELDTKMFFKKGKPNGIAESYYETGVLKYRTPFKYGKRHGLLTSYYSNGKLEVEQNFANDLGEGMFKEYYHNGKLKKYSDMRGDSALYTEEYDSLGNFIKEYREIEVIPEKETFYVGDTYKARIIIHGPKNYKSSEVLVTLAPPDRRTQTFENVSDFIFETKNPFDFAGTYKFMTHIRMDRGGNSKLFLFEVGENPKL